MTLIGKPSPHGTLEASLTEVRSRCDSQRALLLKQREKIALQQNAAMIRRGSGNRIFRLNSLEFVEQMHLNELPLVAAPFPSQNEVDVVARALLSTVDLSLRTTKAPMPSDVNTAGRSLRDARKERGFTQSVLARQLGVTESYLQAIETGRRRPSQKLQAKIYTWLLDKNLQRFFGF